MTPAALKSILEKPSMRKANPHLVDTPLESLPSERLAQGVNRESMVDREEQIHNRIIAYCRETGLLYRHGSMAHKTKRTEGEPDFDFYLHGGVKLEVEVKTPDGDLSPAQKLFHNRAAAAGHKIWVIRSFAEFRSLINPEGTKP